MGPPWLEILQRERIGDCGVKQEEGEDMRMRRRMRIKRDIVGFYLSSGREEEREREVEQGDHLQLWKVMKTDAGYITYITLIFGGRDK